MHVMYGYVEIYDITAATAKAFEMITRSHQKLVKKEEVGGFTNKNKCSSQSFNTFSDELAEFWVKSGS